MILSLLLVVQLSLGGSCGADYPSLNASFIYSGPFTVTNGYVGSFKYVYYYLSATAGRYYSATLTSQNQYVNLNVLASRASFYLDPTFNRKEYYETAFDGTPATISFTAASTECYVIGVSSWAGDSGYYNLVVNDSATSPPTVAPSEEDLYCKYLLGSPGLNYMNESISYVDDIDPGQYTYYFFSSYEKRKIVIDTYTASFFISVEDADVDLYVADASVNPHPTVNSNTYVSASPGINEKIEISTDDSKKCYAIGVYGKTSGSYLLSVDTCNDNRGGVRSSLILGLAIGLPVGLICVAITIALFCVYGLRPKSKVVTNKL